MIHEISPDIFDNQYKSLEPRDEDFVFCYHEDFQYMYCSTVSVKGADALQPSDITGDITGNLISGIDNTSNSPSPSSEGTGSFAAFENYFPRWGDIKNQEVVKAAKLGPVYIFSVNTDRFFMVILESPLDEKALDLKGQLIKHKIDRKSLRDMVPRVNGFISMNAGHLRSWYQDSCYCGRCGHKTEHSKAERMMACPACGNAMYPRINPAILALIIEKGESPDKDRTLLTMYRGRGIEAYVLVAGFLEFGETVEQCVAREVMEEVGIKVRNVRYFDSQPWGFNQNIMMGYTCELDGDSAITVDQSELKTAAWFTREECPDRDDDHSSLTAHMIRSFKNGLV